MAKRLNTDKFCRKLAQLVAETIFEVDVVDVDLAKAQLQDHTSLYSPYNADLIQAYLNRMSRKKHGSPRDAKGVF